MTTDKPVVEQLSAQGETASQEDVPPQTIIPPFDTIQSVVDAAIAAKDHIGSIDVVRMFKEKFGTGKVRDLPESRWQEAGEWFTSLKAPNQSGEPIIPPKFHTGGLGIPLHNSTIGLSINEAGQSVIRNMVGEPIIPTMITGGAKGIMLTKFNGDQSILPPNTITGWEPLVDDFVAEAEQRRQTVQAEAMVNLAVGFTLDSLGIPHIRITPDDLVEFQKNNTVSQVLEEDGSFIISVTPKGEAK